MSLSKQALAWTRVCCTPGKLCLPVAAQYSTFNLDQSKKEWWQISVKRFAALQSQPSLSTFTTSGIFYLLSRSLQFGTVSNAWRLVWPRLRNVVKDSRIITRLGKILTTGSAGTNACLLASILRWSVASATKTFVMKMATVVLGIAQNHWPLS